MWNTSVIHHVDDKISQIGYCTEISLKHILIQPNWFHVCFITHASDGTSLTFLIYSYKIWKWVPKLYNYCWVLFLIDLRNSQK